MVSPVVLFGGGYPSQWRPARRHLMHCGLVSSHLTLWILEKGGIS